MSFGRSMSFLPFVNNPTYRNGSFFVHKSNNKGHAAISETAAIHRKIHRFIPKSLKNLSCKRRKIGLDVDVVVLYKARKAFFDTVFADGMGNLSGDLAEMARFPENNAGNHHGKGRNVTLFLAFEKFFQLLVCFCVYFLSVCHWGISVCFIQRGVYSMTEFFHARIEPISKVSGNEIFALFHSLSNRSYS